MSRNVNRPWLFSTQNFNTFVFTIKHNPLYYKSINSTPFESLDSSDIVIACLTLKSPTLWNGILEMGRLLKSLNQFFFKHTSVECCFHGIYNDYH